MQDKVIELLNLLAKGQREIYNLIKEHITKLDEHGMILEEHTEILNALEENARVTRAEVDKLNHLAANFSGQLCSMKKNIEKVETIAENNLSDIYELKKIK